MSETAHLTLLVAEDDPDDRLFVEEALLESGYVGKVQFAEDGEQLLDRLRACQPHELPSLVLLDLNMPRMGGLEALRLMRGDAALAAVPVVVLSTSRAESDILTAYRIGANAYVAKPTSFRELVAVMGRLLAFWAGTAQLPPHSSRS